MDHYRILRWAAGSTKPLPLHVDFDEDVLLDLVDRHSLPGRFLRRLAEQTPPWVAPKLKDALQSLHSETKLRIIENAKAVRQVSSRLLNPVGVVIIKGMSTYILARQEHTMRCGDIDVLCSDSAAFARALTELGYQQTRGPFLYEIGEYCQGAVEFDLHAYFPVYSYPQKILSADLRPESHPAIWAQSYQMQQHEIAYDDLRSNSYQSVSPETEGINVPDPNMLAIILCSHAFLNYTNMWSISHREKPYVRLGEIADLFDLATHPAFNNARFLALVSQVGAGDAVEWAACTAASLFGRNPLPVPVSVVLGDELPDGRFPRCLWWNFWINLRSGTDELIQRWWLDMDSLITQLGASTLLAAQDCTGRYSTVNTQSTTQLRRWITQAADEVPIPLDFEVSKSDRGVRIDLQMMSKPKDATDRVRVDFGHVASEWTCSAGDFQQSLVGAPANVSFINRGGGYGLMMEFPWKVLGPSMRARSEIPMLVGVAKQSDRGELIDSTLIPLNVSFTA